MHKRLRSALELLFFLLVALSYWPNLSTSVAKTMPGFQERPRPILISGDPSWDRARAIFLVSGSSPRSGAPRDSENAEIASSEILAPERARELLRSARRNKETMRHYHLVYEVTDYQKQISQELHSYAFRADDGFEFQRIESRDSKSNAIKSATIINRDGVWKLQNGQYLLTAANFEEMEAKPAMKILKANESGGLTPVRYDPAYAGQSFGAFDGIYVIRETISDDFFNYRARVMAEFAQDVAAQMNVPISSELLAAIDGAKAIQLERVREHVVDTKTNLVVAERFLNSAGQVLSERLLTLADLNWQGNEGFFHGPRKP